MAPALYQKSATTMTGLSQESWRWRYLSIGMNGKSIMDCPRRSVLWNSNHDGTFTIPEDDQLTRSCSICHCSISSETFPWLMGTNAIPAGVPATPPYSFFMPAASVMFDAIRSISRFPFESLGPSWWDERKTCCQVSLPTYAWESVGVIDHDFPTLLQWTEFFRAVFLSLFLFFFSLHWEVLHPQPPSFETCSLLITKQERRAEIPWLNEMRWQLLWLAHIMPLTDFIHPRYLSLSLFYPEEEPSSYAQEKIQTDLCHASEYSTKRVAGWPACIVAQLG